MLSRGLVRGQGRWLPPALFMAPIGALASILTVWRLGRPSLADWDEATYAEIARETSFFHDLIHLHWNYAPWFNKAPLYIWLTSLFFHLNVNEFWARFASALAGIGAVLIVFAMTRRLHGTATAVVSSLILLACYGFLQAARAGQSDMLLTFFLYLALYAYILAIQENPRWWYLVGGAIGLAFMTKDMAALVAPLAIGLALIFDGHAREMWRRPEPWLGLSLALLIVLPWHVAMLAWQGPTFLHQYVGAMVVQRITGQIEGHPGGVLTYLIYIRNQFYPWAYLLPFAGISYFAIRRTSRPASWIVPAFAAVILIVYTVVQTKLAWYMVPAYPALAILIGAFIVRIARGRALLLIPVIASGIVAAGWTPASVPGAPPVWTLAAAALCIVLAAGALVRRHSLTGPVLASFGALFVVMTLYRLADLYLATPSPVVALAKSVKLVPRPKPNPVRLYIASPSTAPVKDVSHSLLFYSHRKVTVQVGNQALSQSLGCGQTVPVFMSTSDVDDLPPDYRLQASDTEPPFMVGRLTHLCSAEAQTSTP